jgi:Mrp family chromosome partitioning ATPase
MFVDMPPGTGDVPLTVYQSLPITGTVIVTTPQDLVSMIVKKACNMANMMNIPVLGMVENMSYVKCPHCGEEIRIFGDSHVEEIAAKENIQVIARIPIDPEMTGFFDTGKAEYYESTFMEGLKDILPPIE